MQIGDAPALDHPRGAQLHRQGAQAVHQSNALAEQHRHEVYTDLIDQPRIQGLPSQIAGGDADIPSPARPDAARQTAPDE
jgi:hypothetical protein